MSIHVIADFSHIFAKKLHFIRRLGFEISSKIEIRKFAFFICNLSTPTYFYDEKICPNSKLRVLVRRVEKGLRMEAIRISLYFLLILIFT